MPVGAEAIDGCFFCADYSAQRRFIFFSDHQADASGERDDDTVSVADFYDDYRYISAQRKRKTSLVVLLRFGFTDILLIEQFDTRITFLYLLIGISSAFCSGVAYNLVRTLRGREHPLTVVLHFQITGLIVGLIFTFFE